MLDLTFLSPQSWCRSPFSYLCSLDRLVSINYNCFQLFSKPFPVQLAPVRAELPGRLG